MNIEEAIKEKDKRIAILENINEELNNINAELKEDKVCLHCGKDKASYCERLLSGSNKYKC